MRQRLWILLAALVLLIFLFGRQAVGLYVDLLWFQEVGYRSVFLKILQTRAALGLALGLAFFAIVYTNLWIARRWAPPVPRPYAELRVQDRAGIFARRSLNVLLLLGALLAAVAAGLEASGRWNSYLLFANPVPFGEKDPLFGKDISFYVFKLPFFLYLYRWLLFTLVISLAATAAIHYFDKAFQMVMGVPRFAPHVKVHLSILVALLLLVKAWGYKLAAYGLLFSSGNVLYGAAYTDVHARLPMLSVLQVASVVVALLFIIGIFKSGIKLQVVGISGLLVLSLLGGTVYPSIIQSVRVVPNETTLERPFIANHIRATLKAYGLEKVQEEEFPSEEPLTPQVISQNEQTIQNLRLWDHMPLLNAYRQQQSLRPYYEFLNVDVDRYTVNGEKRQVMLAARELNPERIPVRRWSGRRLQYTHGYGIVMNQVNAVSAEGWPKYLIKDIDPMFSAGPELKITEPRIYFGETSLDYNVVKTRLVEFDHPRGDTNVTTTYKGKGGFLIGGGLRRILLAFYLQDTNFLLSRDLSPNSRLLIRRNIVDRVRAVAPFLMLDPDPYIVLSNGRLYWFIDAYTISDTYPYSLPAFEGGYNYLRNSVKVVIDAYHGSIFLYIADPNDPLVKSYSRMFPKLFIPISRMPAGLREHVRYPELLFNKQTEIFSVYHMRDPLVFYQKEDLWNVAQERGNDPRLGAVRIEAYYVMMKLPGSEKTEMVIMRPFTARGKDNMVAWMAARCDGEHYGQIYVYKFPKTALAEGPSQVEARINNDPVISSQITLWDQRGSQVIHGHLLVIPIGRTVLYLRPLFLQAEAATSPIPELTRVIMASNNPRRVVMERTPEDALKSLLGAEVATKPELPLSIPAEEEKPPRVPAGAAVVAPDVQKLAQEAWNQLSGAEAAQRRGDWAEYGRRLQLLRQTLKRLQELTAAQ